MANNVFKMGASMDVRKLPLFKDWIIEGQRDLELYTLAGFLEPAQDWRTVFKDVPSLLTGHEGRFGIHGPILPMGDADPELAEIYLRKYREALEVCGDIGATHMVIHSPFQSLGAPFPMGIMEPLIIKPASEMLKKLVPLAEQAKCTLMIENVFDTQVRMVRSLVEACNSEYVRMSIDTGHAFVMNRWGGGPTPDYWIREAGALLGHLHIQDTDGYTDRHWPPGQGQVGWFGIFQALGELTHVPRMVLEISDQELMRGFEYLKQHGFVE
jgi:sugar phosphate isomerase/epimerase